MLYIWKRYKYGFEYGIENEKSIVYSEYLYVYESVQLIIVFDYDNEKKIFSILNKKGIIKRFILL